MCHVTQHNVFLITTQRCGFRPKSTKCKVFNLNTNNNVPSNTKNAFNHFKTQKWAHKHNETQLSTWNRCPLMSLNRTCSQKQHWRHFVVLLFWGQWYVVSDSMCCCVWSHFVVFGATVLCCDLKRDWEHMLWLRTLCNVFLMLQSQHKQCTFQLNHIRDAPSQ